MSTAVDTRSAEKIRTARKRAVAEVAPALGGEDAVAECDGALARGAGLLGGPGGGGGCHGGVLRTRVYWAAAPPGGAA